MKIKWQWFLGGQSMFWLSIVVFFIFIVIFTFTYVLDLTTIINMKKLNADSTPIKKISEIYVNNLHITINKPIIYRFVRYKDNSFKSNSNEHILLGTFHEWNDTYYIDISIDLYGTTMLVQTVLHETRHMIVEYFKDENIIDLVKYTEEIAQNSNNYYNELFNSGVYLLKLKNKGDDENGKI